MKIILHISMISLMLAVAACQTSTPPPKGVKIGKPYVIEGKTYYPAYDPTYDEEGIASWYGPGFHGKSTATGETFNKHDLTAAHPTLPMPSLVRVTNLKNGKALVVRVNDRGPFAKDRIIDLSKESAQRLGITGLAKVRVQYLSKETEQYIAARNEGREIDMFAYNDQLEQQKNASLLASTAPSDQTFIIEESRNMTQPGDTVANAAPVISVAGADIEAPKPKKSGGILVREAWADEVQPAPQSQRGGEVVLRSPSLNENTTVYAAPAPKAKPVANTGSIFIQVGSFSQRENADKMRKQLASIASIDVGSAEIAGNQWWRVRAGPFTSAEEAEAALQQVRSQGVPDARIVQ